MSPGWLCFMIVLLTVMTSVLHCPCGATAVGAVSWNVSKSSRSRHTSGNSRGEIFNLIIAKYISPHEHLLIVYETVAGVDDGA